MTYFVASICDPFVVAATSHNGEDVCGFIPGIDTGTLGVVEIAVEKIRIEPRAIADEGVVPR